MAEEKTKKKGKGKGRREREKTDRRPFVKPLLTKHEKLNQVSRFGVGGVAGVVTVPFLS
ncbi:hypothetical protein ACFL4G_09455 [Thermodesulfobacteriota bacterium]